MDAGCRRSDRVWTRKDSSSWQLLALVLKAATSFWSAVWNHVNTKQQRTKLRQRDQTRNIPLWSQNRSTKSSRGFSRTLNGCKCLSFTLVRFVLEVFSLSASQLWPEASICEDDWICSCCSWTKHLHCCFSVLSKPDERLRELPADRVPLVETGSSQRLRWMDLNLLQSPVGAGGSFSEAAALEAAERDTHSDEGRPHEEEEATQRGDAATDSRGRSGGLRPQAAKSNRHQAGYWGELLAARGQHWASVTVSHADWFDLMREVGRGQVWVGWGGG